MNDKNVEINRYDQRALQILNEKKHYYKRIPHYINVPNKYYFNLLRKLAKNKLLEIAAGTGQNTLRLIKMKFRVCATDISSESVKVMQIRFSKYKNFLTRVADMEKLPFRNNSFDVVCCAGGLSYGDNNLVMNEIYRVLRRRGCMIAIDSLNHNPIYRLNRYIHYLKGERSKSTLKQMPNVYFINKYIKKFGYGKVKFFGAIAWTFPILAKILSEQLLNKFSNWVDRKFHIKKSAFKFVLILKKINKT